MENQWNLQFIPVRRLRGESRGERPQHNLLILDGAGLERSSSVVLRPTSRSEQNKNTSLAVKELLNQVITTLKYLLLVIGRGNV